MRASETRFWFTETIFLSGVSMKTVYWVEENDHWSPSYYEHQLSVGRKHKAIHTTIYIMRRIGVR